MSLFSDNIRYLRTKTGLSQEKFAEELQIMRDRYRKYDDGTSEPPYEILRKIANYHHVSIDLLLSVDVRKVPFEDLLQLEDNRILLPITIDSSGDNFIEIIPLKARAGYLSGYADPEFIENLQHISLPWLGNGKCRAFPITGDSMPPHTEGSFIVGRYVERLGDIVDGKTYILLTKNEGIVYKRVERKERTVFALHSDNSFYESYDVKAGDVLEVWEFACSIGNDDLKLVTHPENIKGELESLRREIREVHEHMLRHVK